MRHRAAERRRPTATNGLPEDAAGSGRPHGGVPATVTASLDTRSGHVGVTVSNSTVVPGVVVDFVDPADLAHKAGIRKGDIIMAVDGSSASALDHETFIETVNTASARGAVLSIEYMSADEATTLAVERAAKENKSLFVAYLLWLTLGAFGTHHFYLGRDEHAILHAASLNGALCFGWWRDFFCMPRYVRAANEDIVHQRSIAAAKAARPDRPPRGMMRTIAMVVFGTMAAHVLANSVPLAHEAPWPVEVTLGLENLLQIVGATVTVSLVGRIAPHENAAGVYRTASRAGVARMLSILVFGSSAASGWAVIGAIWGWRSTVRWVPAGAPLRRLQVSVRRRAAIVIVVTSLWYGTVLGALYQRGSVTVPTGDGGRQVVRFKDAANAFLRSPFVKQLTSNVFTLLSDVWHVGWKPAFQRAFRSFDLAGETHACEVLGLDGQCLESWPDVKRAYRALALENHPDKHASASEEERAQVEARFREIQEAYEHLTNIHNQRKAKDGA